MVDLLSLSTIGEEVETEDYLFTRYEQQNGHDQVILGREERYDDPDYVIRGLSGEEGREIMKELEEHGEEALEQREDVQHSTRSTNPTI